MKKNKRKLEVITHYQESDKDFSRDYVEVSILLDGKLIQEYGDRYHDKGDVKAEGFVEGFLEALGKVNVVVSRKNVNDAEDFDEDFL